MPADEDQPSVSFSDWRRGRASGLDPVTLDNTADNLIPRQGCTSCTLPSAADLARKGSRVHRGKPSGPGTGNHGSLA